MVTRYWDDMESVENGWQIDIGSICCPGARRVFEVVLMSFPAAKYISSEGTWGSCLTIKWASDILIVRLSTGEAMFERR